MVELKIEWNEKNISEFVKYNMFARGRFQKAMTIIYAVCFAAVLVLGIAAYAVTGSWLYLLASGAAMLMLASYYIFAAITTKSLAKKIYTANKDSGINIIQISADDIIVCSDGKPVGRIPWDTIAEIAENKGVVYMTSKDSALLLLEKKNITGGTAEELDEIIKVKNAELSKTA